MIYEDNDGRRKELLSLLDKFVITHSVSNALGVEEEDIILMDNFCTVRGGLFYFRIFSLLNPDFVEGRHSHT